MTTTRHRLSGTGLGILAAWAATVAILAVANIGSPVRVVTGWSPDGAELTVIEVLITSAVSIAIAGLALSLWDRRSASALHQWSIAVAVLAALSSVPLWRLDVDAASKATLTLMHLTTGTCAVLGQHLRPTRVPLQRLRADRYGHPG